MPNNIPSWLDPATEITQPDQPLVYSRLPDQQKALAFILLSCKILYQLQAGLNDNQVLEIVANAIVETGWGRWWKGCNMGGWKITEAFVKSFKQANNGKSPRWYRAAGHVASGDQPIVYYRGFDSLSDFYIAWIARFVPRVAPKQTDRYYKTSLAFWNEAPCVWFRELCLSGYKGDVTAANPNQSVEDFKKVCRRARTIVAQYVLGLTPSGNWMPSHVQACKLFQKEMSVPATGILDEITFEYILGHWRSDGMPLNANLSF